MGIDFGAELEQVDAYPHWSYGGFHQFRVLIAELEGIRLTGMKGFGGTGKWEDCTSPLVPFLNHSDCGGELNAKECKLVAPRLKVLVERLTGYLLHQSQGRLLVQLMEACVAEDVPLEFC